MNKKIIIQIPFNVQGFNKTNEFDEEWIRYRLKIFCDYSLKSLVNQTNQHFTAMLRTRNQTLKTVLDEVGGKLPDNVIVVAGNYDVSIRRCIEGYNYLYLVRLDSDDCLVDYYVDLLQNYIPKIDTEVLITQCCYDYDIIQERLCKFWYRSPQGFALIYRVDDYLEKKRYQLKNGHGGAILLKHEILKGYNYLNTIHRKNNESFFHTSDTKNRKNLIEISDEREKQRILRSFGI